MVGLAKVVEGDFARVVEDIVVFRLWTSVSGLEAYMLRGVLFVCV